MEQRFDAVLDARPEAGRLIAVLFLGMAAAYAAGLICGWHWQSVPATPAMYENPEPLLLPPGVAVFHDAARNVTCWTVGVQGAREGIACLPDEVATTEAQP
ncbi:MAG TPA: hypothetical protein VFN09_06620 [Rhodanobacteraceae bacterium]|nr:hypothetical protein [Rhodanobacteraceae bacterium]